ncbi:unnamed protein product [Amoebophrya sp. A25]|nr:unnamed protein product [Amoebophrya sp. A25]|eukprot:GSA25T00016426001.1
MCFACCRPWTSYFEGDDESVEVCSHGNVHCTELGQIRCLQQLTVTEEKDGSFSTGFEFLSHPTQEPDGLS